jgi:hypothetical protein
MPAGDYWERVTHLVRSTTTNTSTGAKQVTFTEDTIYWCYTEFKKPKTESAFGVQNRTVEVIVHVRGYPDIDQLDRLYLHVADMTLEMKGGPMYDYGLGETILEGTNIPTIEASV